MHEKHGLAAMGTEDRVRLWRSQARGCGRWVSGLGLEICSGWQALAEGAQASTQGGSEESIVANLHEVMGQHMLEEAVDEFLGTQGTPFLCTGLGVAIAKGHPVIFQLEEPVVAQGDPEDVRGQVLQSL